jgi:hypothetical protein
MLYGPQLKNDKLKVIVLNDTQKPSLTASIVSKNMPLGLAATVPSLFYYRLTGIPVRFLLRGITRPPPKVYHMCAQSRHLSELR